MAPEKPSSGPASTARGPRRVQALDGFRAYAILGVVAVHLLGASGVLAKTDGTGAGAAIWAVFGNSIDVFFIISGFVLFLPTVRRNGEFGSKARFWIGRAARLFPAYWLVLAIAAALLVFGPDMSAPPSVSDLAIHLAVLQTPVNLIDANFAIGFGVNGPLWLLSVVVTFYVLLPFVARGYWRHPLAGLAVAAAVTIAWKQTIAWGPGLLESASSRAPDVVASLAVDQFPGWAFSFGLGMTAAWFYWLALERRSREQLQRAAMRVGLVALPAFVLPAYLFGRHALTEGGNIGPAARQQTLETMLHSSLRTVLILVVILGPLWLQAPFVNRITARLAELSYGVYLIHWLIVVYVHEFVGLPTNGTLADMAIWTAVVLPPSLLFAALSRRWLELPILGWVQRRTAASPPFAGRPAADAPARP